MKILLVGGSSSLGRALYPALSLIADIRIAGRSNSDIELDLCWPQEQFKIPDGFDCVVNLAANFGGPDYYSILAAEEINAIGAFKLAEASRKAGVSYFVQISSIFAEQNEQNYQDNSYAVSKRHGEDLLNLYCQSSGLALFIVRPSRIYGDGDIYRRHQPFLYALLDQAQLNKQIVLFGSNDAVRNFIHVDDVVAVISRAIQLRIEGTYQCVGITNVTISEIAETVIAASNSESKFHFDPYESDIPDNFLKFDDRLFQLIGIYPKISLREGILREVNRRRLEL